MPVHDSVAFLLAQVGAAASDQFGERAAALGLTRGESGLLRVLSRNEPMSQRALAAQLELVPSRLVVLVDELAGRGLIERKADAADRRAHAVQLTAAGRELMSKLSLVAREHDHAFCAPLTAGERAQLGELLQKLAGAHGLRPHVHPGYKKMTAQRRRSR
jgi:DNA-binding MarR family transcriptional regulator